MPGVLQVIRGHSPEPSLELSSNILCFANNACGGKSMLRLVAALLLAGLAARSGSDGDLPVGLDGRPLNLDFETGDLRDWRAEGEAFRGQPVRGDTVHRRRQDMHSRHQGQYWIGTYEVGGDAPTGVLVSSPFRITKPWASFLVGGGHHKETRVEVVLADGTVLFQASGQDREDMRRVVVDLRKHLGKVAFVRVIDQHSGHWGHINFDDFRLHDAPPKIQARADNPFPYQGLKAEEAARVMQLPPGFEVRVFAAEPDVRQPIAMTIDERGRLWVVEAYTYPVRQPEGKGKDRILIFEDTDGDGRMDRRKIFCTGLNLVSGIEVGFGGVWVGAAPYLLFIPDRDRDDRPDGPPEVVLDGWGYQDTHETLNSFIWGPDGWLYGCHGVFTHSRVGKPGTPDEQRVRINAGVWRYHPVKKRFEVFAYGTSNPWGVDFDDFGQAFITACVIPHLYHVIQGGRYQRQAGQHFNPYVYDDIKTIADHLHYKGAIQEHAHWGHTPITPADTVAAGGGHAHAGAMVYLGDAWPAQYRGKLFMNNIHGARTNMDILERRGSGFVGHHGPDFLITGDYWSQMLYLRYGPDGQVFVIDWYDRNQCHRTDPRVHDRSNGRVYKIVYRDSGQDRQARPTDSLYARLLQQYRSGKLDLARLSDVELARLQHHPNDWYVRVARRLLQERAASGGVSADAIELLRKSLATAPDPRHRLRAAWALHVCNALRPSDLTRMLEDKNEYVRAWAIQLGFEDSPPSELVQRLPDLAAHDPSPIVRLYLASAMQRTDLSQRWEVLRRLLAHAEDNTDHNLPYMYWYAFEPLVASDPPRAIQVARKGAIRLVRRFTFRRVGDLGTAEALELLTNTLGSSKSVEEQLEILAAFETALKGKRKIAPPAGWAQVAVRLMRSPDARVRDAVVGLSVRFGDKAALRSLRDVVLDRSAPQPSRMRALDALIQVHDPALVEIVRVLTDGRDSEALTSRAIRGAAAVADPVLPKILLDRYPKLRPLEKRATLAVLSTRREWAAKLLDAVAHGTVPRTDLTADLIRQLVNVSDDNLRKRIEKVWGHVRRSDAEKQALIERYRKLIERTDLPAPDVALGRAVFQKICAQCHTLFGKGGHVGPDLTGSNRADLDYALSNVLDPSAVMANDYIPHIIATADGRVITGIVRQQTDRYLVVQTADEQLTLARDEIEAMRQSEQSMMPDNLLEQLTPHEVRSLFAYLASPRQTPILARPGNISLFFSGTDLTYWLVTGPTWRAENGTLEGRLNGGSTVILSEFEFEDFELSFDYEVDGAGEFSVLFRCGFGTDGKLVGYQIPLTGPRSGAVLERGGRGILLPSAGLTGARSGAVRLVAQGSRLTLYRDGKVLREHDDPAARLRGAVGFEIRSDDGFAVRIRNLKVRLLGDSAAQTAGGQ